MEWRWRVDEIPSGVYETKKAGDDYSARLYVVEARTAFSSGEPEPSTIPGQQSAGRYGLAECFHLPSAHDRRAFAQTGARGP